MGAGGERQEGWQGRMHRLIHLGAMLSRRDWGYSGAGTFVRLGSCAVSTQAGRPATRGAMNRCYVLNNGWFR